MLVVALLLSLLSTTFAQTCSFLSNRHFGFSLFSHSGTNDLATLGAQTLNASTWGSLSYLWTSTTQPSTPGTFSDVQTELASVRGYTCTVDSDCADRCVWEEAQACSDVSGVSFCQLEITLNTSIVTATLPHNLCIPQTCNDAVPSTTELDAAIAAIEQIAVTQCESQLGPCTHASTISCVSASNPTTLVPVDSVASGTCSVRPTTSVTTSAQPPTTTPAPSPATSPVTSTPSNTQPTTQAATSSTAGSTAAPATTSTSQPGQTTPTQQSTTTTAAPTPQSTTVTTVAPTVTTATNAQPTTPSQVCMADWLLLSSHVPSEQLRNKYSFVFADPETGNLPADFATKTLADWTLAAWYNGNVGDKPEESCLIQSAVQCDKCFSVASEICAEAESVLGDQLQSITNDAVEQTGLCRFNFGLGSVISGTFWQHLCITNTCQTDRDFVETAVSTTLQQANDGLPDDYKSLITLQATNPAQTCFNGASIGGVPYFRQWQGDFENEEGECHAAFGVTTQPASTKDDANAADGLNFGSLLLFCLIGIMI
jgi:hypothetical protein